MAPCRSISCSGRGRRSAMPTIGGRSKGFITAAPALIRAVGSPARPATTRRAPSSRIGVGPVGATEDPGPASELFREGGDQAFADPLHRDLALPQNTFRDLQRPDLYPVGADEGQR